MAGRKVIALFAFKYNGKLLDRNEIITLDGTVRDEQLVGLRYFALYDASIHQTKTCDNCSRKFAGEMGLIKHKRKPDCMAEQVKGGPTRADTAVLLDTEVEKVVIDEAEPVSVSNPEGLTARDL